MGDAKWIFISVFSVSALLYSERFLHPSSQTARGLAQAPVSSRNRSSTWTRFGWLNSWGRDRRRVLVVRYFQRAAVKRGHFMNTCLMVWIGSPHGQAICSGVCREKKRWIYSPAKACPVIILYRVGYVSLENLASSRHCLVGRGS